MSANTKIEWCDHTFNPWIGCQKVSAACLHCYTEESTPARVLRAKGVETWGVHAPRQRTSTANWKLPLRWNAQAKTFAAQHGRRQRVFCASLADWADNVVPIEWLVDLLELVRTTPNLDWLLLTKRIGIVLQRLQEAHSWVLDNWPAVDAQPFSWWLTEWLEGGNPSANLWLGITIVNQPEADRDITKLLSVPARVRFLSMEPLLGPVDLASPYTEQLFPEKVAEDRLELPYARQDPRTGMHEPTGEDLLPGLHWVIVGGESGPGARPMHPDWVTSLRDQCAAAGVPFLFKQWGEWRPISQMSEAEDRALWRSRMVAKPHEDQSSLDDIYGRVCTVEGTVMHMDGSVHHVLEPNAWTAGAMTMYRVGKKAAGRSLDGRTHDEFPS